MNYKILKEGDALHKIWPPFCMSLIQKSACRILKAAVQGYRDDLRDRTDYKILAANYVTDARGAA